MSVFLCVPEFMCVCLLPRWSPYQKNSLVKWSPSRLEEQEAREAFKNLLRSQSQLSVWAGSHAAERQREGEKREKIREK